MKNFFLKNWPWIILLMLALVTRFWNLGSPAEVVFDEVHFGKFVSAYFTGEYYFDIHPPLGKLLIAAFAGFFGFEPGFDFDHIGEVLSKETLFILRFLPALFGSLLVVVIYKLILIFGLSRRAAFFGAFLIIFDNALLIESKFVFTDLFFLVFGFGALALWGRAEQIQSRKKQTLFWILAGIFTGLALSVKWTSLAFLAIIFVATLFGLFRKHRLSDLVLKSTLLILSAALIYISVFAIHFKLLPRPGPGSAFMSRVFQDELVATRDNLIPAARLSFLEKFIELNTVMYKSSAGLTATHPDGSRWYEWPLVKKPVYYWVKTLTPKTATIYLIGNPIIWWLVLLGVVASIFIILFVKKARRRLTTSQVVNLPLIYLFLFGYFLNLLPFIFVKRVAFLYHYLPALIFGILILALLMEKFVLTSFPTPGAFTVLPRGRKIIYASVLIAAVIGLLTFVPISYGLPVAQGYHDLYQKFISFLH